MNDWPEKYLEPQKSPFIMKTGKQKPDVTRSLSTVQGHHTLEKKVGQV